MTYRVYQTNKKTGVTYVYKALSFWDKKKKQSRNKQICIGKLDPNTRDFIPSKRLAPNKIALTVPMVTASAKIIGPSIVLNSISELLNIIKLLKSSFPKEYQQILTMAYYLTSKGGPLSQCEAWCKSHSHPFRTPLSSQRISSPS